MISSFIASAVGGMLFAPSHTIIRKETKILKPGNPFIGYHKWLENRRDEEIESDLDRIQSIYDRKCHYCPKCREEIAYKIDPFETQEGRCYRVLVSCGCKNYKKIIEGCCFYDPLQDDKIRDEVAKFIQDSYIKIRGKVSYEKIKQEFLDDKLSRRKEEEKYYPRVELNPKSLI